MRTQRSCMSTTILISLMPTTTPSSCGDLWRGRQSDRRTPQAVVEALTLQNQLPAEALDTKPLGEVPWLGMPLWLLSLIDAEN